MPDVMKVNGAFKAGTLVAEVRFVHSTPVEEKEMPDSKFRNINNL